MAGVSVWAGGEDGAEQADLQQGGGKGVQRGCVAALGALHGNAEAESRFGDTVFEQNHAGDDLHRGTRDAVEDPLDVMDEDHGILEGVQPVGADAGAEAESSEDTGQAADIDRHAEVAPQESAGVGAIGGQSFAWGPRAPAGDQMQDGDCRRAAHACTSARKRVQRLRKETEPLRMADSVVAYGAHSVRWLPARRSQRLPQRSQYFRSILCG